MTDIRLHEMTDTNPLHIPTVDCRGSETGKLSCEPSCEPCRSGPASQASLSGQYPTRQPPSRPATGNVDIHTTDSAKNMSAIMHADTLSQGQLSGPELQNALRMHGLPSGGEWFWTQMLMFDAMQKWNALHSGSAGGAFPVAWDKKPTDKKKGMKMFAFYPSVHDFFLALCTLPVCQRYAYEIIVENKPCRTYADVEWVGERDNKHEAMRLLVQLLRDYCWRAYKCSAEVFVACSSRAVDAKEGSWKNSYHLVIKNLVFQNNHCGGMKAFWENFVAEHLRGDQWYWLNNGKKTHCIDMHVYTRNRVMRLPLCSKRGTDVCFHRISGDPLDADDEFTSRFDEADPDAWRPFVISNPPVDGDNVVYLPGSPNINTSVTGVQKHGAANVSRKRGGASANVRETNTAASDNTNAPGRQEERLSHAQVKVLEKMLKDTGIPGCVVTGQVVNIVTNMNSTQIFPLRNENGPRKCLANKGETHKHNNAHLLIQKNFVMYRCKSERCKGKSYCLGKLPESWYDDDDEGTKKKQKTVAVDTDEPVLAMQVDEMDQGQSVCDHSGGNNAHSGDNIDDESDGDESDDGECDGNESGDGERDGDENDDGERDGNESGDSECDGNESGDGERDGDENDDGECDGSDIDGDDSSDNESDGCSGDGEWDGGQVAGSGDNQCNGKRPSVTTRRLYRHNITDGDLLDILQRLNFSNETTRKKRLKITSILKKYGYKKVWEQWSHDINEPNDWHDAGTVCDRDLNYIVSLANQELRKNATQCNTTSDKVPKIVNIEKIYYQIMSLRRKHKRRITKQINEKFLCADLFNTEHQVTVVQSCTGTGKTTSLITHACAISRCVLSICARKTQVDEHCRVFRAEHTGLQGRTMRYDDKKILSDFRPGDDNYVTTVDSLTKIKDVFHHCTEMVGKYILYLDEFHTVLSHVFTSSTLDKTRKEVLSALVWLVNHAGKVILMDNLILNRDLDFIDTIRRANDPIAFIINDYQKYTGLKVFHHHDDEAMITKMLDDLKYGRGFTTPCNTKRQVEDIGMRLRQDFPSANVKCYTSECGEFDAENLDADWSGSAVVYSPTITTGIDFNPVEAQNVYMFLDGDQTVDPPTVLQMITRNRNIKEVHICATNMRNRLIWPTVKEMHHSFDDLKQNTKAMAIMKDISNCNFNDCTGEFEYSENKFSALYRKDRWLDNVMRSSYIHTLDTLLESRGFQVIRDTIIEYVYAACDPYDWEPIRKLVKQEKEQQFDDYMNNRLMEVDSKWEECIDRRLTALQRTKEELRELMATHQGQCERYMEICTDAKAFKDNQNIPLALYTDHKLRTMFDHNGIVDYDMKRQETQTAKCLLLRQMITIMNDGIGRVLLKPYDLTLQQSQYDENKAVELTDGLWQQYRHHKRTTKTKPVTCKHLMTYIYFLAKDIFGCRFIIQTETSKNGHRCYNYSTDKSIVTVAIALMNWRLQNMDEIHDEIVERHNLQERKRIDMERHMNQPVPGIACGGETPEPPGFEFKNPNLGLFHCQDRRATIVHNERCDGVQLRHKPFEPLDPERSDKEEFHRKRVIHDNECYARVLWCLKEGGPDFHPAHEHKHRAPGDDANFFYGIPPWHPDGSVNPAGVPPNFGEPEPLAKNWSFIDDWDPKAGWSCHKCNAWVPRPAQKYQGQKEPADWWWCMDCRSAKARTPTLAEKRQQKAAANCRRLDDEDYNWGAMGGVLRPELCQNRQQTGSDRKRMALV